MSDRKITIKIGKDGKITADAEGFTGKNCLEATDKLLDGLGTMTKQDLKDEYYRDDEAHVLLNQ